MNYKEVTRETYDNVAEQYEINTKDYLNQRLQDDVNLFLSLLPGKKILDVGSGLGRDSLYFKNRGFSPVCIDFSKAMVDLCSEKGLEAHLMDIENISFDFDSFDGIWAYASLLHLPKTNLNPVLTTIHSLLKHHGLFYIGMKEGTFEGFVDNPKYPGKKRHFAHYTAEELETELRKQFQIKNFSKIITDSNTFINYLCLKEF